MRLSRVQVRMGIDGNSPAAGAVIDSWQHTTLSPEAYLNNSDSFGYFEATGEALITGATGNNVRDIRILLECGDLSSLFFPGVEGH